MIKPIKIEDGYQQTLDDKLEVIRSKINELITEVNAK